MTDWHKIEEEYGHIPYVENDPNLPDDHIQTRAFDSGFTCPRCRTGEMYATLNHMPSKLDMYENYIILYQCAGCGFGTAAPVLVTLSLNDLTDGPSKSLADHVQAADDEARDIINRRVIRKMATGPDLNAIRTEPYHMDKEAKE